MSVCNTRLVYRRCTSLEHFVNIGIKYFYKHYIMNNEEFRSYYHDKFNHLDRDDVLRLSKAYSDPQINNVVKGIHAHCYGLALIDDTKQVNYQIYYLNGEKNLVGELLELELHDEQRHSLLLVFSKHIAQTYNLDIVHVFNTFQEYTRSMCEQLDYYTIAASELQQFNDPHPMIAVKNARGIIVLPFMKHSELYEHIFGKLPIIEPAEGKNFIYLMHNNRNNLIKIGKSINPRHREKTLQAEEPEITMIAVWEASGALERYLHRLYKDKRLRGEWFQLSYNELLNVKQQAEEYLNENRPA